MEVFICWLQSAGSVDWIKNVFASVPGVVLGAFSLYFAYQKLGNNVLITYSIVCGVITERRISDITLINKKNKPITIFSIQAIINKHIVVEVERFQPAMVLKPLESVYIKTTPFSCLYLGKDRYNLEYLSQNKVDIYIITEKAKIKCTDIRSPSLSAYFDFKHYEKVTKRTERYNGKVYNDRVKYAVVYMSNSKEYTAFIEESGFIREDWGFKYNMIPVTHMTSKEKVKEYLALLGYDKFFQSMAIDEIDKR